MQLSRAKEKIMKGLANKRRGVRFLCTLFLTVLLFMPTETEAETTITIGQGASKTCTVGYSTETITVILSGTSNRVIIQGKPTWISGSGSGPKMTFHISANASSSPRSGEIVFMDPSTSKTWRLSIRQQGVPTVTIKFDSNGGSGNIPSNTYTIGSTYGSLPAGPTPPTGYTFEGWYTAVSGGSKVTASSIVSSGITTLYARYKAKVYTISFDSCSGSDVSSLSASYGTTYGTLPTPTRTGYTFAGWYTAASGGTQITSSGTVTNNITLYAHWTANKYTVKFDGNGGSDPDAIKVTYDSTYGTLPTPTRTGYKFLGWFTAKTNGTRVKASTKVTITATQQLYAHWQGISVTVSFDSNGGSDVASITVTYDGTYGTLPVPTRDGYTFLGWFTAKTDGTKVADTTKVTATADQTLYALWEGAPIETRFDVCGGSGTVPSRTYTVGEVFGSIPAGPTPPTGYKFTGWFRTKSGGYRIAKSSIVKPTDKILYAQYQPKTFTVTFDSTGGSYASSKTVTYDEIYGPMNSPTRPGYVFRGWFTEKIGGTQKAPYTKVTITSDITLYAHWERETVTVHFDSNGGSGQVSDVTYTIGETFGTLPNAPKAPAGYTFAGWFRTKSGGFRIAKSSIVQATDTVLYAHWTGGTITVRFDVNGGSGTVPSCTYTIGDTFGTLPSGPKPPAGYEFVGWFRTKTGGYRIAKSSGVKATDTVLYAQYKKIE